MTAPPSPSATSPTVTSPSVPSSVPPPIPVETHPNRGALKRPEVGLHASESTFLAPEHAYKSYSPPRLRPLADLESRGVASLNGTLHGSQAASAAAAAAAAALRPAVASLRPPPAIPTSARHQQDKKKRSASRKSRPPGGWKKLLWIRQPCEGFDRKIGRPADDRAQILTIIPILKPFLTIFSAIRNCVLTISGH